MKVEKLFDLMSHMHSNPGEDFTGFGTPLNPAQQEATVVASLQAFVHQVASGSENKAIQAFAGSSDLPQLTKDVFNVTLAQPDFDLGWQAAFRGVPLRKGELSWEIATMSDPAEFVLTPEGAKCYMGSVSGEKVSADIQKYSKGLGLTWELMEGRKLAAFIERLDSMRAKLYALWARIHYGLLAVAAANNQIAWQGVAEDSNLKRDIETLNKGAYDLAEANKDKGYGNMASPNLILYISPKYRGRVNAALKASLEALTSGTNNVEPVDWTITPVYTFDAQIPANKGLLVLPGQKIQNAVYLQELNLKRKNIETLAEERSYWTAFGAIVADNDQCFELAFS